MGNGDFRIRLGDNTELGKLKHAPPDNEYRTIHEWIVEHAPGSNVNSHKTKSDEIVAMKETMVVEKGKITTMASLPHRC